MVSFWTACFLFYHLAIGIPWGNASQLNIIFSMLIEICMSVTYKSEPFAWYGMDFWCIVASMGFQLLFGLKKKIFKFKEFNPNGFGLNIAIRCNFISEMWTPNRALLKIKLIQINCILLKIQLQSERKLCLPLIIDQELSREKKWKYISQICISAMNKIRFTISIQLHFEFTVCENVAQAWLRFLLFIDVLLIYSFAAMLPSDSFYSGSYWRALCS